ncbi:hypothetical protein EVAR_86554_1 [Eumeta japonica]|uniref:PI3K/PI4K catalytic domain-containing protein n=1 Tax=Eumeta variegata TaxID=151549 RepID=A0A4C1ZLM8_EUMVA|nr:hypothetical protein EVAR_86554_1 [Eumeta japonica]
MNRNVREFDDVIWDTLAIMKSKLPDVFHGYREMFERSSNKRSEYYKRCLKLVRCTQNSLTQYCRELRDKLERNDAEGWNTTMDEMWCVLLETEAGGLQYDYLRARLTVRVRPLRRFEKTDAFKRTAREILSGVLADASQHAPRPTLDLDQLCPALARYSRDARADGTRWLEDALRIPKGLLIVKIEKQVELISSKQRPALMSLVLSDGRARRFLLKTGDARPDAAAQRLQRRLNRLTPYPIATYQVLALDGDFGVIEFVEGCTTLRALIASELDLEAIERSVRRPRDTELVATAAEARLAAHRALCRKASPVALRRAVERDCSSVQEFVHKQRNYIDSLGAMTVAHWLLGLGDRHLDNVLLVRDSGRALAVDWESVLERALQLPVPELLPARLTPQLLALAGDRDLVRSRVECVLEAARAANATLVALARVAFLWHPEYDTQLFQDKLSRMCKKMSGELTSWESTRAALRQAAGPQRQRYVALLDAAHAPSAASDRSVERQASLQILLSSKSVDSDRLFMQQPGLGLPIDAAELLEQCTSAALLSATRASWEPWL